MQVWRLASALDSLKFKFVPGTTYSGQAGHRFWAKGATAAASSYQNSQKVEFQFDGAASTLLGFSAVASAIVLSLF